MAIGGMADVIAEMALFAVATIVMFRANDMRKLLEQKTRNWLLIIAAGAVLGPIFEITQGSSAALPILLIPASVFWVIVFAYSIIRNLSYKNEKPLLRSAKQ